MAPESSVPLVGFAAWSGTGKTTLLTQLIRRLTARELRIGIIKHAHHRFDVDYPGKDSYELRKAGATQTLIASDARQVRIVEKPSQQEPTLTEMLAALDLDSLDVVLVEGFRHLRYDKIELHRPAMGRSLMYPHDSSIVAVASDVELSAPIPTLDLNDAAQIEAFIVERFIPLSGYSGGDL